MELLFRVIDKRTEFFSFGVAEAVAEKFLHFSFDGTRSIAKHVLEGFVFTVQVGQEVLGSFGRLTMASRLMISELAAAMVGKLRDKSCK